MGGGGDGVAGGDHIGVQGVGGGHLHGSRGHDGVQLLGGDLFFLVGNLPEGFVDLGNVLFAQIIAQVFHSLSNSCGIIVGGQVNTGFLLDVGGSSGFAGLAHPSNLVNDAAHLGHIHIGVDTHSVALGGQNPSHVGKAGIAQRISGGLDLGHIFGGGDDAGICHGKGVGAGNAQRHTFGQRSRYLFDKCGKFSRQHGACGVAQRHGGGTGAHGSLQRLLQECAFTAGGIVSNKLNIITNSLTSCHSLGDGIQHGFRLFVEQILHLHRAYRGADLQTGLFCLLQSCPYLRNTFTA